MNARNLSPGGLGRPNLVVWHKNHKKALAGSYWSLAITYHISENPHVFVLT
jgi:hypothetical protein